jgi:hypothetical protein
VKRIGTLVTLALFLAPLSASAQTTQYADRAGEMWAGPNLGVYLPTGDAGDFFDTSIGIGGNFLYQYDELIQFEGLVDYVFLNGDPDAGDFSGSLLPLAGGVRYEFNPGLHGDAGLGIYRLSIDVENSLFDPSETDLGIYFGGGYEIELETVNVDLLLRLHWPDLDDFYVAFSGGILFPLAP